MAASVWIRLSNSVRCWSRLRALMMPVVTVLLKSIGLPIAITGSPCRSVSLSPIVTAANFSFARILITAIS